MSFTAQYIRTKTEALKLGVPGLRDPHLAKQEAFNIQVDELAASAMKALQLKQEPIEKADSVSRGELIKTRDTVSQAELNFEQTALKLAGDRVQLLEGFKAVILKAVESAASTHAKAFTAVESKLASVGINPENRPEHHSAPEHAAHKIRWEIERTPLVKEAADALADVRLHHERAVTLAAEADGIVDKCRSDLKTLVSQILG